MKAAQYSENGTDFSAVKLTEVAKPEPTPGSVVVKVVAAAINPVDAMVMAGYLKPAWSMPLPFVMGYDFSGVVAAVHADDAASMFKEGDAVFAVNWGANKHDDEATSPGGAFAEFIRVPIAKLSRKPDGVPHAQAAAVALVGTTARQLVQQCARVGPGNRVLVLGGASAVGSIVVQLAKRAGAWVATTASKRTAEYVAAFGADLVVDYTAEKWQESAALKGLDAIIVTVSEDDAYDKAVAGGSLKQTGRFATITGHGMGYDSKQHPPHEYASAFVLGNSPADQDALAAMLADGSLKLAIDQEFPFTDAGLQGILAACQSGKAKGKNVLNVSA